MIRPSLKRSFFLRERFLLRLRSGDALRPGFAAEGAGDAGASVLHVLQGGADGAAGLLHGGLNGLLRALHGGDDALLGAVAGGGDGLLGLLQSLHAELGRGLTQLRDALLGGGHHLAALRLGHAHDLLLGDEHAGALFGLMADALGLVLGVGDEFVARLHQTAGFGKLAGQLVLDLIQKAEKFIALHDALFIAEGNAPGFRYHTIEIVQDLHDFLCLIHVNASQMKIYYKRILRIYGLILAARCMTSSMISQGTKGLRSAP